MKKFITALVGGVVTCWLVALLLETSPTFQDIVLGAWNKVAPFVMPYINRLAQGRNLTIAGAILLAGVVVALFAWAVIRPNVKPAGRIPR